MANEKPYAWKPIALEALRNIPVLSHACRAAGIARSTMHEARASDPEFEAAVQEAMEEGIDRAEQELYRRAVVGYEEPLTHQGHLTYHVKRNPETGRVEMDENGVPLLALDERGQPIPVTVRKHSDALLALFVKGRRKKVYAERTELTGADGGPLQQQVDDTTRSARVAQLLAIAAARKEGQAGDDDETAGGLV